MKKYKMFYQAAALVLAAVLATGMLSSCTVKDSGILMAFDGTDTGKNADIGIYGTATFADLITSQVQLLQKMQKWRMKIFQLLRLFELI